MIQKNLNKTSSFLSVTRLFAVTSILMFFPFSQASRTITANAAVGFGMESINGDEIWMGWTIFESGNVGYGQAGGDSGKAYGRYQFDYRYALPEFLSYVTTQGNETYSMLFHYTYYPAGSEKLLSKAGLGLDWVKAYQADPNEFSRLQDEFAYHHYYLPAKQAMANRGIDLDKINDPVVKGTIYSLAIRDGANDNGIRAAWQSYLPGDSINTWLNKLYDLEASRHPGQANLSRLCKRMDRKISTVICCIYSVWRMECQESGMGIGTEEDWRLV